MQDTPAQAFEAAPTPTPTPSPAAGETDMAVVANAFKEAAASDDGAPDEGDATAKKKKKKKKLKLGMKIEHQTKGRVRMKVAAGKGDPELLQKIGETFSGIPGVQRITANPTTGSLVLHYNQGQYESFQRHLRGKMNDTSSGPPPTQFDELANKIQKEAEYLSEHSKTARIVVHICKRADREIKLRTHNLLDLKIGLAFGVLALPLIELGASAATPIWLTLGVFSLNHFVELQRHHELEEKVDEQAPVVLKTPKDKTPSSPA